MLTRAHWDEIPKPSLTTAQPARAMPQRACRTVFQRAKASLLRCEEDQKHAGHSGGRGTGWLAVGPEYNANIGSRLA
jgi:hypothetical protein